MVDDIVKMQVTIVRHDDGSTVAKLEDRLGDHFAEVHVPTTAGAEMALTMLVPYMASLATEDPIKSGMLADLSARAQRRTPSPVDGMGEAA